MVKAATDVSSIVDAYVKKLKQELDLERVILSNIHTDGVDGEPSEILFIVVSATFEALERQESVEMLGLAGQDISSLIMAWPYTPNAFAGFFHGEVYDGVLAQLLSGSREVYLKAGATPLQTLRKAARRKS